MVLKVERRRRRGVKLGLFASLLGWIGFGMVISGWGREQLTVLEIFFDSRRLNRSLFFLLSIFSWCHKLVKIFLSDKTFQTKLITSERGESAIIRAIYRNKYTSFIKENTPKKSHSFAVWYFLVDISPLVELCRFCHFPLFFVVIFFFAFFWFDIF